MLEPSECPALEFRIDADRGFQQQTLIPACLAFWDCLQQATAPALAA
ncbi:MAG: hypothetical protein K9L82_13620 [Chromatiaceae bacterium]|nr:hypothetical protein [Chromatiaceae bacterium]MCF7993229.1 hypothetical protein [Chromatiaceae bacterium]MCF8004509.1 hypothetical protein [Chromatiaceae bacterium]MCF8017726.1 hypothetical protein [Chromatiaceae bacterium]